MTDLAQFILARIAEDETAALEAEEARGSRGWLLADDMVDYGATPPAVAEHIARHDPARVLAECEAKRRIVELCEIVADLPDVDTSAFTLALNTLEDLARPYADHPDHRADWWEPRQ